MNRTKVSNSEDSKTIGADVISKSATKMTVVLDGTDMTLQMSKRTPHAQQYVGRVMQIEFYSTGE